MTLRRRDFLKNSAWGALCLGTSLPSLATPLFDYRSLKDLGPLLAANEFGMRVPEGFR
ncbi:MAG: twin-arginine translocation signal domain-containing protein, partial [Proteobacteria bacterium]